MTSVAVTGAPTAIPNSPTLSPSSSRHPVTLFQRNTTTDRHLTAVLNRCVHPLAVRSGKEAHAFILRHPDAATCYSQTSLINFYAKCGRLNDARAVFDGMPERDVVTWTAILMAYAECDGRTSETMTLLREMACSGVAPNRHTVTVVLRRANLEQGKQLHAFVIKNGWASDEFIGSSLTDFYAKNQILGDARLVFDQIEHKDVVCYNALISNYGRFGCVDSLISLLVEMGLSSLVPNKSTFIGLLNGCANFGILSVSKQFHAQSIVRGFNSNEEIQGVIIDMYSKCGDLEAAHKNFGRIGPTKNVVAWNSMIGGYGKHGLAEDALQVFESMERASVLPDHITFTLLLSACSHSGLVDVGLKLFNLMDKVYKIPARNEHYCCMVDLLGRAGMVREAYEFITKSGCKFGASVWSSLLASCRLCGDVEIGEAAARRLFEIEPDCSGSYVALAGIFANKRRWSDAIKLRELMEENGVSKTPGCSWIEAGGLLHEFKAGKIVECDGMEDVYSLCNSLNLIIRDFPRVQVFVGLEDDHIQE